MLNIKKEIGKTNMEKESLETDLHRLIELLKNLF
jgi:hypothetical protein